jgi:ring-1,2-phenylacetyl-CoA epoxidase subunit PaaC
MQASVTVSAAPAVQALLRLGDTCLIHAQRLSEWCGHAPILEEDIALTNMALDLIGQARALLTRAGQLGAEAGAAPLDEDQLAFLRDERDYRNPTLVELPLRRGGADFADTVLRNLVVATWLKQVWSALSAPGGSSDAELAAIAAKALKEARYHQQHAADWCVRLGDGTAESARRMQAAVERLWPYTAELFQSDATDQAAAALGLCPAPATLQAGWQAEMQEVFDEAGLQPPALGAFRTSGRQGIHSEHLGFLLAEMQHLQRAYPGGAW